MARFPTLNWTSLGSVSSNTCALSLRAFLLISVGSLALPGAFVFRFFKSFRGIARQLPCCLATLFFRGLYFSSFHVFGLQLSISVCARLRQALALFQQLPQSVFLLCSLLVRDKRPLASFFVLLLAPFQTFAPVLLAAVCKKISTRLLWQLRCCHTCL